MPLPRPDEKRCVVCGVAVKPRSGGASGRCSRCYKRQQRGLRDTPRAPRHDHLAGDQVTIRLPEELVDLVLTCAIDLQLSRSELIRRAIAEWIRKNRPDLIRGHRCL
jgi:hypothetical protein